jgi:hypothetical protein
MTVWFALDESDRPISCLKKRPRNNVFTSAALGGLPDFS